MLISKGDKLTCKEEFGPFLKDKSYEVLDAMYQDKTLKSIQLELPEEIVDMKQWLITEEEYQSFFYSPCEVRREKIKKIDKKNKYI